MFCVSKMSLFCFHSLENMFASYRNLNWQFLFFRTIMFWFYFLLTPFVSDKKSNAIFTFVPLSISCLFFWRFLRVSFYISFSNFIMCFRIVLFMFLVLEVLWPFWICECIVFIKFENLGAIISSYIYFLSPFFLIFMGHQLSPWQATWNCSTDHYFFFLYFKSLFSSYVLFWIVSISKSSSSWIFSSAMYNLLVQSSVFF